MLFFRNPLFCATAAVRAAFNSDHDGKALQPLICSLSGTCASADAAPRTSHIIVTSMGTKTFFLFIIFLSFHRFCSKVDFGNTSSRCPTSDAIPRLAKAAPSAEIPAQRASCAHSFVKYHARGGMMCRAILVNSLRPLHAP